MRKEIGARLTGSSRPFWTETNAKSGAPSGLIGKPGKHQECSPAIVTAITGAFEELDCYRTTIESGDNPFGPVVESTLGPASQHREVPTQAQIFVAKNIHEVWNIPVKFKKPKA